MATINLKRVLLNIVRGKRTILKALNEDKRNTSRRLKGFKRFLSVYSCIEVHDIAVWGRGKRVWSVICIIHQSSWRASVKWNERRKRNPAGLTFSLEPFQTLRMQKVNLWQMRLRCLYGDKPNGEQSGAERTSHTRESEFLQIHSHAEMWSKYIMFWVCTAAPPDFLGTCQTGNTRESAGGTSYSEPKAHTATCSLSHSVLISPSPPWPPELSPEVHSVSCAPFSPLQKPRLSHTLYSLLYSLLPGTNSHVNPSLPLHPHPDLALNWEFPMQREQAEQPVIV